MAASIQTAGPTKQSFSPYEDNGGTSVAIAGKDFVVLGADTRLSIDYSILSRDVTKIMKLSDTAVLSSCGMKADRSALHKLLVAKLARYEHANQKAMSTEAMAQMLSTTLYYRRFFPFYTFNLLAGLNNEGRGVVYGYDAVGSFQELTYAALGSGEQLIMPILDSQVGKKNQVNPDQNDMSLSDAVDLLKDVFASAAERDIYTGDSLEICMITGQGIVNEKVELRHD